jgi:D-serine dehydratase
VSHPHTHGAPRLLEAIDKGLGPLPAGALPAGDVSHLNWNLLREDVSLPAAVLYADRLAHNLHWMQQFVTAYGVRLAPHGKTTMAPRLFRMQLAAGAWGITLATAAQVQAAYHGGVRRVLMANQLVGRQNMALIADLLANHGFEFFCLVDSVANVDRLGAFFRAAGQPLNVLLEVGLPGGRAGVRDLAQRDAVLAALARWPDALKLAGLELYEAVVDDETSVRAALRQAVAWTGELIRGGYFARQPALLSGAGSSWYDVVAEEFKHAHAHGAVDIVLRPGCYLTHDAGIYHQAQHHVEQRSAVARRLGAGLKPALQVWAYVQSRPQAACAIVGLGRRDAGSASGLPAPALHYRPDPAAPIRPHGVPVAVPGGWQVTKMMDQQAYLKIGEHDDLEVGDMVAFDVSHPCLTFDKWRHLLVVDSAFHVTEVIDTCF